MKISKSKQELARIIRENGGWRDGAEFATQDKGDLKVGFWESKTIPIREGVTWKGGGWLGTSNAISCIELLPNWHQTILSRAEYFHLYPAPDADADCWIEWSGGKRPVEDNAIIDIRFRAASEESGVDADWDWEHSGRGGDIIAYRLHKPEQAKPEFCESVMRSIPDPESKPTIEQLAAYYRNAKDYAERKRQEADDAKADADAKLKALELAGEALGLLVSPITEKQGPELVITDWRDLQTGDVISVSGKWWEPDSEYTVDENDGSRDAPIRVGGYWALIGECSFKFISRP